MTLGDTKASQPQPGAAVVGAAIVGAQKCGTTTLAAVLAGHPEICLARNKEAHLFDRPEVQRRGPTPAELAARWPAPAPGQVLVDATPSYLYLPGCLEALVRHSPEVRLVVVLRAPGERAVSHHGHERRIGMERWPFAAALALERARLRRDSDPLANGSAHRHGSYLDRGRYAPQLRRLAALTDRYHVLTLHDLVVDPARTIAEVHEFLGVSPAAPGPLPHLNPGDGRRHRWSVTWARWLMRRHAAETETLLGLAPGALR